MIFAFQKCFENSNFLIITLKKSRVEVPKVYLEREYCSPETISCGVSLSFLSDVKLNFSAITQEPFVPNI